MQVIQDILRQKQAELEQLQREIEALHTVLQILQQVDVPARPPETSEPAVAVKTRAATASDPEPRPGNPPRQFP